MEMDSVPLRRRQKNVCSILSIVKASVFVLIAVFVLCVPLGDPSSYCDNIRNDQREQVAKFCLCDWYKVPAKVARKTKHVVQTAMRVMKDVIYQAKLKLYSVLEKIDKDDLCRSVCCADSADHADQKKNNRRTCKCMRKCIKKK